MTGVPRRVGLYLGVVQFAFAACWTVYVIFLPQLAAQAGIPKTAVIWILMMDQLIFLVTDYLMGVASDRATRTATRLAPWILGVTGVSCALFLLMPFVAPQGSAGLFSVAAALAPYLGLLLKGIDPRVPFVVSSLVLALVTFGILAAERALVSGEREPATVLAATAPKPSVPGLAVAAVLVAVAFQVQVFLNTTPQTLRFASAADLPGWCRCSGSASTSA